MPEQQLVPPQQNSRLFEWVCVSEWMNEFTYTYTRLLIHFVYPFANFRCCFSFRFLYAPWLVSLCSCLSPQCQHVDMWDVTSDSEVAWWELFSASYLHNVVVYTSLARWLADWLADLLACSYSTGREWCLSPLAVVTRTNCISRQQWQHHQQHSSSNLSSCFNVNIKTYLHRLGGMPALQKSTYYQQMNSSNNHVTSRPRHQHLIWQQHRSLCNGNNSDSDINIMHQESDISHVKYTHWVAVAFVAVDGISSSCINFEIFTPSVISCRM